MIVPFIIFDPRREEIMHPLLEDLPRLGIEDYIPLPGCIIGPTVEACINMTHKAVIRLAKEMGLEEACVLEADAWFPHENGWRYFLKKKPHSYDIYLGGIYDHLDGLRNFEALKQSFKAPYINYTVKRFSGFHSYFMHSSYFDSFLESDPAAHIDVAQDGRGAFKVCYPFACIQRPGWSANHKKDTDYNGELLSKDVYGKFK